MGSDENATSEKDADGPGPSAAPMRKRKQGSQSAPGGGFSAASGGTPSAAALAREWAAQLIEPEFGLPRSASGIYAPLRTRHKTRWLSGPPAVDASGSLEGTWELYGVQYAVAYAYDDHEADDPVYSGRAVLPYDSGRLQLLRPPAAGRGKKRWHSAMRKLLPRWPAGERIPVPVIAADCPRLVGRLKLDATHNIDRIYEAHVVFGDSCREAMANHSEKGMCALPASALVGEVVLSAGDDPIDGDGTSECYCTLELVRGMVAISATAMDT